MSENYFSLLGLQESFTIDLPDLEKRYFDAQRKFHPDRLVGKSPSERSAAISASMRANEAYEILKSPLKRANYILSLHGIAQDKAKPSQAVIMESMELRENLAETTDIKALDKIEAENDANKNTIINKLEEAFKISHMPEASELSISLSYIEKMSDEIRAKKKRIQVAL